MLNLNSVSHQIPLPIFPHYRILNRNDSRLETKFTIMIPISEEEEKIIDNINNKTLRFTRGDKTFNITINDIYCYGEIDFDNEEDLNQIDDFNFLSYLGSVGIKIVSNYDYDTHSCKSKSKYVMWTETWDAVQLTMMAHGYLGKPERILLFNKTVRKK